MRYLLILSGVVCLAFMLLPACASQPEQQAEPVGEKAPSTEADVAAIKVMYEKRAEAAASGNMDGWHALFSEDSVMMAPNELIVIGKEALREWGKPFFETFDMELEFSLDEIEVCDKWAFVRGAVAFRTTSKADRKSSLSELKFIDILERQTDGTWKFARHIYNSDSPPPGEPTT